MKNRKQRQSLTRNATATDNGRYPHVLHRLVCHFHILQVTYASHNGIFGRLLAL